MSKSEAPKAKIASLADFMVRYDLTTIMEEARLDYTQASSGTPRLLNQKDITARFRKPAPPAKPGSP